MELRVAPEVFAAFPGLRIAVVTAAGLDVDGGRAAAARLWEDAWHAAAAAASPDDPPIAGHPRIAPWRERFRALGISPRDFPSSIEALVRRARKGGEPFRVNPLVDWYNAISLRHVAPAGGFDADALPGPLELRQTREGDHFESLSGEAAEGVPPGEIAYAAGDVVLTRHVVWRQSRHALITRETRRAVLVSEILGELPAGVVEEVLADLSSGLRDLFGGAVTGAIVEPSQPAVRW